MENEEKGIWNEELRVESRLSKVENVEWRMKNGKMENGEWEKENEKLKNGKWRVENGEWENKMGNSKKGN